MAGYLADQADGTNETLGKPISKDGLPHIGIDSLIPTKQGRAVQLRALSDVSFRHLCHESILRQVRIRCRDNH